MNAQRFRQSKQASNQRWFCPLADLHQQSQHKGLERAAVPCRQPPQLFVLLARPSPQSPTDVLRVLPRGGNHQGGIHPTTRLGQFGHPCSAFTPGLLLCPPFAFLGVARTLLPRAWGGGGTVVALSGWSVLREGPKVGDLPVDGGDAGDGVVVADALGQEPVANLPGEHGGVLPFVLGDFIHHFRGSHLGLGATDHAGFDAPGLVIPVGEEGGRAEPGLRWRSHRRTQFPAAAPPAPRGPARFSARATL